MTEQLADLLAARLAPLPFTDRVVGLVRPFAHDVPSSDSGDLKSVTVPVAVEEVPDCEAASRYLLPDSGTASILYFEDHGSAPGGIAGVRDSWRSTLRLLAWVNPAHFVTPPTDLQLIASLTKALGIYTPRRTDGSYLDLSISLSVLPADAGLFSRYTGYSDSALLLPPYRVAGLELVCTYRLTPACAEGMPERTTPPVC